MRDLGVVVGDEDERLLAEPDRLAHCRPPVRPRHRRPRAGERGERGTGGVVVVGGRWSNAEFKRCNK